MAEPNSQQDQESSEVFGQQLANQVANEFLKEQKRNRRWGIFFKFLFAIYLLGFLGIYLGKSMDMRGGGLAGDNHTALIEVEGAIGAGERASADNIVSGLRAAYENKKTAGIILRINSPGGSPVQSGYINDEIFRLKKKHPNIPIYAVISDICASGGYYIASAADEIYADKASLVGSIGVIMAGFGFVDAIDKLGVERRVLHAGENKAFMDPFAPLKEDEVAHVDAMLDEIYEQFKAVVKKGREGKLMADDETVFSGLLWTGERAVDIGLVDKLGSSSYVARKVIGAEDIINFSYKPNYLDRFAERLGSSVGNSLLSILKLDIN